MKSIFDSPTPVSPLPVPSTEGDRLAEDKAIHKLGTGLASIQQDLISILNGLREQQALHPEIREQFLRAAQQLRILRQMAEELEIVRQLERSERVSDRQQVDLLALVQEVAGRISTIYRLDHKPVCVEADQAAQVMADPQLLRRALEAMLTCTVQHSQAHRPVMVYLELQPSSATVHMVSQGCDELNGGCPCDLATNEELASRVLFVRKVAWANWGWVNLAPATAGQGLDFALTLPLADAELSLDQKTPLVPMPDVD